MTTTFLILIGFGLVLFNAFFVAAEFGMVRLRHTRVAVITEEHPIRGPILAKIHSNLDTYLSACQLGITLASLGLGWVGEPAFAGIVTPLLQHLGGISEAVIEVTSFIVAFTFLSFLHIVVGELMPKSLAIRQSEQISLWTALPLYWFYWLMYPPIKVLNFCSVFFLKLLRLDEADPGEQFHSNEEIKIILQSSHRHGELGAQESTILSQTLALSNLRISDVMSSVDDLVRIDKTVRRKKFLAILSKYQYSRYPIYDTKTKKYIGLVHVKGLQDFLQEKEAKLAQNLEKMLRPLPMVSHRLPVLTLLRKFQAGLPHFALVMGKHEKIVGFITFDNVLHAFFGGIEDEFHRTKEVFSLNADGSITVKGDCPIYALERALKKELALTKAQEEEIATISGLILHYFESVPKEGDKMHFLGLKILIEKMQGARILQLRIKKD